MMAMAKQWVAAVAMFLVRVAAYPSIGDYMPVSNVLEHSEIVKDVIKFSDALAGDPPDYSKAKDIYMHGGGHSCKSQTKPRTLQDFALKDLTNETFADKFFAGGFDKSFWDTNMLAALEGTGDFVDADRVKRVTSLKKMVLGLVSWYASHELDAAIKKVESGEVADASGAPHAWDEGWAFYYGSETDGAGSPWEVAKKRDADFNSTGATRVKTDIVPHFNKGLHFVRDGTQDVAEARAAADVIYQMWAITYLRAALKYLEISEATYSTKAHAEGYAYFLAIDGFIASYDADAAKALRDALLISKTSIAAGTFCSVRDKVYAALPKMGLDCRLLGSFKDSTISCSAACSASVADLPSGRGPAQAVDKTASSNTDCTKAAEDAADAAQPTQPNANAASPVSAASFAWLLFARLATL